MTEPDEVFEAMSLAMADAELAPNPSYESMLKAALGAAKACRWKIVPMDATQEMFFRFEDAFSLECFKAAIEAAPDLTESGGE